MGTSANGSWSTPSSPTVEPEANISTQLSTPAHSSPALTRQNHGRDGLRTDIQVAVT
ncbi:MAG: hypothetical protein QOI50_2726, partial [Pseudonocardiales bacterium]|nr:hypothetical protein [Pseudonocardiales bacterium]